MLIETFQGQSLSTVEVEVSIALNFDATIDYNRLDNCYDFKKGTE